MSLRSHAVDSASRFPQKATGGALPTSPATIQPEASSFGSRPRCRHARLSVVSKPCRQAASGVGAAIGTDGGVGCTLGTGGRVGARTGVGSHMGVATGVSGGAGAAHAWAAHGGAEEAAGAEETAIAEVRRHGNKCTPQDGFFNSAFDTARRNIIVRVAINSVYGFTCSGFKLHWGLKPACPARPLCC